MTLCQSLHSPHIIYSPLQQDLEPPLQFHLALLVLPDLLFKVTEQHTEPVKGQQNVGLMFESHLEKQTSIQTH